MPYLRGTISTIADKKINISLTPDSIAFAREAGLYPDRNGCASIKCDSEIQKFANRDITQFIGDAELKVDIVSFRNNSGKVVRYFKCTNIDMKTTGK